MEATLTKEEYRELKKHGRLKKDGFVYRRLAKLGGKLVTIAQRKSDEIGFIVEVKREN